MSVMFSHVSHMRASCSVIESSSHRLQINALEVHSTDIKYLRSPQLASNPPPMGAYAINLGTKIFL